MAKPRVKTGERRVIQRQLRIDVLPPMVHRAIQLLHNRFGLTWGEIERISALPYNAEWKAKLGEFGFVDWDALPGDVRKKFPEPHLTETSLLRWYDLRVTQVRKNQADRWRIARETAQSFAEATMPGDREAVLNAARDVIFTMLQGDDDASRTLAAKGLLALGDVMNTATMNAIRERKVVVEERRATTQEKVSEAALKRFDRETEKASAKLGKGKEVTLDDINRLRERVFGLGPVEV